MLTKGYWVAEHNANCLPRGIISTKSECKAASRAIGLKYVNTYVKYVKRPAGCYTRIRHGRNGMENSDNRQEVYFNNITDPDLTSPKEGGYGICVGYNLGMITVVIYLTVFYKNEI